MRLPRRAEDIAGTVSVVSETDIKHQVVMDLEDIVRYQPGISVTRSPRGGNQGFTIRGIGGVRVLNLIDGIRSIDNYFENGRDFFETEDLKSVEIIRGPASALYGADALGGVVLFKTRDPKDYLAGGDAGFLGLNLGGDLSRDEQKATLIAAQKFGSVEMLAQYTHRDFSERKIEGGVDLDPLDSQSDNFLGKLVWNISEAQRLKLTAESFREKIDSELDSEETDCAGQSRCTPVFEATGRDEKERYRVSLDHGWQLGGLLADTLDSKIYWQKTDGIQTTEQRRRGFSLPSAPFGTEVLRISEFEFNQEVRGGEIMLVKALDLAGARHTLVYGVSYEQLETERPRNRCEHNPLTGEQSCSIVASPRGEPEVFPNKTFPDTEATRIGIYVQDEIVLGGSGLTLIPALRYDRHKLDTDDSDVVDVSEFGGPVKPFSEGEVSFNFGLVYSVTD